MDVNADIQYSNDDSTASIDEDSFSTIANDNLSVSYAESLNVAETDYEGKAAGTSGYSVDKRPFPPSKSHSEPRGYNYSQRVSINRELESRLKLLLTTMKCRRELGQPLKKEDIPDDLLQHLYNGKANGTLYWSVHLFLFAVDCRKLHLLWLDCWNQLIKESQRIYKNFPVPLQ